MRRVLVLSAAAILTASSVMADFSYQETVKMTGGMVMRMQGHPTPPQESATYVKGNRMARLGPDRGQITDLDKETVTNLNFKNKTYSVMTFAEMRAMMNRLSPNSGKEAAGAVSVQSHETGKSRTIGAVTAKEMLVTVKIPESEINEDVWIAPMVPGYDEVRQFQSKMAQKMGSANAPGMQRTMAEAVKALNKVNGVPVLKTSSITTKMPPGTPPAQGGAAAQSGPMIETSTEMRGFSSAPVDASKFEIPAGFKKVDESMGMRPNAQRPTAPAAPAHQ
jgi:hypothetical protein